MIIKSRRSRWLPLLFLLLASAWGSACQAPTSGEDAAVISWARQHLVPVDLDSPGTGLGGLSVALASARVVGVGESRHDTREQLLFKAALVRQLVEQGGFRLLFFEESAAHAFVLDEYVQGLTDDLDAALGQLAGWYLFDVEEMRPLIRWIRNFNASRSGEDQVRIFGVDITAPAPAVRGLLTYLAETPHAGRFDDQALGLDLFDGDFWPQIAQRFAGLTAQRRQALEEAYSDLATLLDDEQTELASTDSQAAHDDALRHFDIAQRSLRFSLTPDLAAAGEIRERSMAALVLQTLDDHRGARGIYWAANLHVATAAFRMPAMAERAGLPPDTEFTPAGVFLREQLTDAYLAIGATFGSGGFGADLPPGERNFPALDTGTLDGMTAGAAAETFWLDLRRAPAEVTDWLAGERVWRAQDADALTVPAGAMQLLFHVEHVTRSRPSAGALRRYSQLPAG